ncbi:hypothetical protein ASPZODRAFT_67584 [Penicilliopsis zonata CBS 506.65]|uniref:Galactosyl transferase GMA12/MNN10 family protein n=1 Tax=Penicilliopsis zonata CBS 506.65 TaxID=1073090 RepID=A0A1L9SG86_9EURO|nr:hypothetical protein ASPZODRAFT_67584 [Penicilliopsis zonata CBS 506.65]OJJ46199.1 hypothetical protein ASPZODRAFT_67584 [Penicilliopsis zonata CBS 506.65]
MSLSRSPSPRPGGGWSSPGLTAGGGGGGSSSGTSTPRSPNGPGGLSWAAAKAKSDEVRSYPSFATRNNGFFSRQKRKISASLPRFRITPTTTYNDYHEKNKRKHQQGRYGHEPWRQENQRGPMRFLRSITRLKRTRFLLGLIVVWIGYLLLWTFFVETYRRSALGGGRKFVIVLASNVEGGVMEWKGAREWAVERNSIRNKKKYAQRWGYELEIVNMLARKKYSHEWRESWEKVDVLRETMRKYPDAEWFWWLDLDTWIMEYSYSLQDHIFDHLETKSYRDINVYNPLNITHPRTDFYLDALARSSTADHDPRSIEILLSQDCGGFNLGSFFIRRSIWTDRLLDAWWDPVMYEQKHMEWEHKEQDSLEYLYASQPWIRSRLAFAPQRLLNSFPPGACGDGFDPAVHYQEKNRDFLVNMAGCQFGRDCWGEMYQYRELSNWLNRTRWERFKEGLWAIYLTLTGQPSLPRPRQPPPIRHEEIQEIK